MGPKLDFKLDEGIAQKVVTFALHDGLLMFKNNCPRNTRRMCMLNEWDLELSKLVRSVSNDLYAQLGVIKQRDEPLFGNFIGVNTESGYVPAHTDLKSKDEWHVRINFLIQKPISGGNPVIQSNEIFLDEGGCWINFASEWLHKSTPVVGTRERVVLSLGKLVDATEAQELYNKFNVFAKGK